MDSEQPNIGSAFGVLSVLYSALGTFLYILPDKASTIVLLSSFAGMIACVAEAQPTGAYPLASLFTVILNMLSQYIWLVLICAGCRDFVWPEPWPARLPSRNFFSPPSIDVWVGGLDKSLSKGWAPFFASLQKLMDAIPIVANPIFCTPKLNGWIRLSKLTLPFCVRLRPTLIQYDHDACLTILNMDMQLSLLCMHVSVNIRHP